MYFSNFYKSLITGFGFTTGVLTSVHLYNFLTAESNEEITDDKENEENLIMTNVSQQTENEVLYQEEEYSLIYAIYKVFCCRYISERVLV
jgi:hypothetical protein